VRMEHGPFGVDTPEDLERARELLQGPASSATSPERASSATSPERASSATSVKS
jgi:hypothetical protein